MGKDDLRFGDRGGGGGASGDELPPEVELIKRAIMSLIALYVLYAVANTLIFNGALPTLMLAIGG